MQIEGLEALNLVKFLFRLQSILESRIHAIRLFGSELLFSIHFLSSFYWLISKTWTNILEPKHRLQKTSHATIACFGAKIMNLVCGKEKGSLLVAASHPILHRRNKTVIHLLLTYIIYNMFMLFFL